MTIGQENFTFLKKMQVTPKNVPCAYVIQVWVQYVTCQNHDVWSPGNKW